MNKEMTLLFVLGLALRLGVFALGPLSDPAKGLEPDSGRYLVLAEHVNRFNAFGKVYEDGRVHREIFELRRSNGTLPPPDENGLRPESFRVPGYPLFLAAIERGGGSLRATLAIQCLMGALSACGVAAIAGCLTGSSLAGFAAGLLWALHPGLIVHDNLVLSESLFNALIVFSFFLALKRRRPAVWFFSALLIGLAALIRPYVGLVFIPMLLFIFWNKGAGRPWLCAAVIFAGLLPSLVWAGRNFAASEGFRVSTVAAVNLLYYAVPDAMAAEEGEEPRLAWEKRVPEMTAKLKSRLNAGDDVFSEAKKLAVEELLLRPAAAGKVLLKSMGALYLSHSGPLLRRFFGYPEKPLGLFSKYGGGTATLIGDRNWAGAALYLALSALNLLVVAGALAGIAVLAARGSWGPLLGCLCAIVLLSAMTGSLGLERFRMPMMLPLSVLAGAVFILKERGSRP